VTAGQYIVSLDDGTREARASEQIAVRLADALEVAWAPIPVPASHPHDEAQAPAVTADRDWVLAVAMPWSGDGERLRRLVEAMPYPLLVVSPAAAKRRAERALALSQHVVLHVAESADPASERVARTAATAMGDWRATLGPDAFARHPAVGVELIVTSAANLARRRMRRALERVVAPLLVVPAEGDRGWPELEDGWSAPLALLST
jgi:hypothetical protein